MRTPFSLLLVFVALQLSGQNFPDGFHFYLPPGDSTSQRFLPEFPKQPITDFLGINADGHFEVGGQPVRFWGVNVTTGACFPKKTKAPWIAARMRKMGINIVRFNNMDNPWAGDDGSIFYQNSSTTQVLNYFTLDKLHYFLAQLKQQGIYANINLHMSRRFRENDGVLYADSIGDGGKAVTIFDRQLIALQKQYATQLLTPVSLYTGLALTDDPVMAMVEITNENSLYTYWRGDRLQHVSHDGVLMQRHCDTLDLRWNQFLQNKYLNQTALATAWNALASTPGANQQLLDNNFEDGNPNNDWTLELHDAATATLSIVQDNPYEGQDCALVNVTNVTGTGWHIQFKQESLSVEAGKTYAVHFAARADQPATIYAYTMRNLPPWTWYGAAQVALTPQWQEFTYTFVAPEDNADFVRFAFSFENQLGNFYFDKMSLADAGAAGVLPGESLTNGNIRRINYGDRLDYTSIRVADMTAFYLALQRDYFSEMRDFLRDELGVQVPITGSNGWGGPSDIFTQQEMDYVDDHTNWDYPQWSFDGTNWNWVISNTPMVKSDWWTTPTDVFGGLAMKGKPYTVSQYYHVFPNRYQVEMMPWMAAYGAFHGADGIMFYNYNEDFENWEKDMQEGHYAIHRNTSQMALSPMYGYAFRQGLIAAESNPLEVEYSQDYLLRQIPQADNSGRWGTYLPYNGRLALTTAIRTSGFDGTGAPDFSQLPAGPGAQATTSTGQTSVDFEKGLLKTVTPQFVSVCGFLNENGPYEAGAMKVLSGNDFAAVAWLSLTGEPLGDAEESVLTVSSSIQNTDMVWENNNTVNDNWGSQPTEVSPMELMLELSHNANYLRLYPLSETGAEGNFTTYTPVSPGKFMVNIDQSESQTLWYGVEASNVLATGEPAGDNTFDISPNPASGFAFAEVNLQRAAPLTLRLLDVFGREVNVIYQNSQPVKAVKEGIDTSRLAAGLYFVECRAGDWGEVKRLVVE